MFQSFATATLAGLLAMPVFAQESPMSLCTDDACGNCPNSLTTAGTGYPSCVIYDRDTVLGGSLEQYENVGGNRMVYYDVAEVTNPECRTIIRTPAGNTDENCGVPIYGGPGGVCFGADTKSTLMIQFCCGTGDCGSAGVKKRADGSYSMSSAVLYDGEGNMHMPISVGDSVNDLMEVFLEDFGLNSSTVGKRTASPTIFKIGYPEESELDTRSVEAPVSKRDCDTYTANGAPYTKTGTSSMQVSGYICDSTTAVTITNEMSVSRTTTFGSSVSDPFGIVSASIEFSTEESASQSYSYMFTPEDGQCGHVSYTPFYTCTGGTITGCEGGDQTGEVCTAKRITDKQVDGAYLFVQTG